MTVIAERTHLVKHILWYPRIDRLINEDWMLKMYNINSLLPQLSWNTWEQRCWHICLPSVARIPALVWCPSRSSPWVLAAPTGRESPGIYRQRNKTIYKREGGNVLFNNALNAFYLRLYGIRHMVKDHSDSEKGNLLPPHSLLFPIKSMGCFICTIPDRIAHTTAFVTPVVEHWLEQEIAQWVHPMKDRSDDPSHNERTLLSQSYISLPTRGNGVPITIYNGMSALWCVSIQIFALSYTKLVFW